MTNAVLSFGARVQRAMIIALVLLVIVTAVCGALLVFADVSDDTVGMLVGVPGVTALCLALLVAYSAVLRRKCGVMMRLALLNGMVFAIGGMALSVWLIVVEYDGSALERETLTLLAVTVFGVAVALAYTGALAQARTGSKLVRILCVITGASAWIAAGALMLLMMVVSAANNDFGTMILLGITLIITSLITLAGTIAVPVALASQASKRRIATESIDARVQVHFGCPKCGERQTHRPGFAKCPQCHAGIMIEIEEPRCECGYLLYQLTGDHCPECGRAVGGGVSAGQTAQ